MTQFKSISHATNRLTVKTDNPTEGAYFKTDGMYGISVSDEDAKAIRDMLIARHGLPEPVTFQSQFAKLAVGDQFRSTSDLHPAGIKAIKIDEERYFNYTTGMVRLAAQVGARFRITKVS